MLYRRIRESSRRRIVLLFPILLLVIAPPIQAQTDGSGLPAWLSLGFEQQSRMQVLNGQFRAGLDGDDQGFEWRNALTVNMDFESFSIETEIADMRTYFTDEDSPLDSFFTNPLDITNAFHPFPPLGTTLVKTFAVQQGHTEEEVIHSYLPGVRLFEWPIGSMQMVACRILTETDIEDEEVTEVSVNYFVGYG